MLRYLTILAVTVALAVSAQKQDQVPQQASANAQTFVDLENKWNDALVKKDVAALEALLGTEYVSTDEQGHLSDRTAILSRVKSGARNFQSMKLSDLHVHLYGNVAVVTGINTVTGTTDGKQTAPRLAFTDTFVRQSGTWRAVATHVSEVR